MREPPTIASRPSPKRTQAFPRRRSRCSRRRALPPRRRRGSGRSFRLDSAPDADERVSVPLAPDRRLLAVTRVDDELVRQPHEHVHDRATQVVEPVLGAADRAGEERVPGENRFVVDDEGEHSPRVTGRSQRLDLEIARADDLAVAERLCASTSSSCEAQPYRCSKTRWCSTWSACVCREQERGVNLEPVDRGEERLDGRARVDEHGGAADVVRNQVRVREPTGSMLRSTIMGREACQGMTSESRRDARSR